jgi:tRNA(fMet)-specific endonuclease VapC
LVEVSYLIDSDICVEILRGKNRKGLAEIEKKLGSVGMLDCLTSVIVEGELRVGVHKATDPARAAAKLDGLLSNLSVLPVDREIAKKYGEIRAYLESMGVTVGGNDLLIAATALRFDLTLLTRNLRDYERVPDLKLETI